MLNRMFILIFAAVVAVSCSSDDELPVVPVQDLEEKNVEFQLYTTRDFSSSQFDDAYVEVTLVLLILDTEGVETTKFAKTFDRMHFRDLPQVANKIIEQQKLIYDKNSEYAYVSYGLSFEVNGMRSAEGVSYSLPKGQTSHVVTVEL